MAVTFTELSPAIGVVAAGVGRPADLTDEDRRNIYNAFNQAGLILFRGLDLTPDEHIEFTSIFGAADIHPAEAIRMKGHPEIIVLGSPTPRIADDKAPNADAVMGKIKWHSDLTYTVSPSRGALLLARQVPPELGQTGFIDTAHVYDELPNAYKEKIELLRAVHSVAAMRDFYLAKAGGSAVAMNEDFPYFPPVVHPLVHTHPVNGRKVLNISPGFLREIVGMELAESDDLIAWLTDFATQDRFAYFHDWDEGDMLVWDNFRTMHTAVGYKSKHARVMHRTTLKPELQLG